MYDLYDSYDLDYLLVGLDYLQVDRDLTAGVKQL